MVFITGKPAQRSPLVRLVRFAAGCLACAAIVFALWSIPYDVLREERLRLYGETHTTGVVTQVRTDESHENRRYLIDYKYVDQDGFARQATAPLPKDLWERFRPGHRTPVFYANPKPGLSRVPGEIEPAFQLWLRGLLH